MGNKSDKCPSCKYRIDPGGWAACDGCIHDEGLKDRYEPMTNADRIRNMTDAELAKLLSTGTFICEGGRNESPDSLRGIANRVQGVPGAGT